jgi:hypothetical protein
MLIAASSPHVTPTLGVIPAEAGTQCLVILK